MKKKLYGNYLGIVITGAEYDPEFRGRCQIFFPGVSNTLYKKINKNLKDLSFGHIDPSVFTPDIIKDLRDVLPWAECAAPVVGSATSAYYDQSTGSAALVPDHNRNPNNPVAGYPPEQPLPIPASSNIPVEDVQNFQSIQGNSKFSENELRFAMRIAASESGAGIGGNLDDLNDIEQSVAYSYGYGEGLSIFELKSKGRELIDSGKVDWKKVDIGYVQSNQYDSIEKGAINTGSYKDQIIGTAQAIRNLSAKNPSLGNRVISSIQSGNFNEADIILGSKSKSSGSIGTKYFALVRNTKNVSALENRIDREFNGNVSASLNAINNELPPTPTIEEYSSGKYVNAIDSTVASANPNPDNIPVPPKNPYANNGPKPVGLFSCPAMGAKLWAFFYGGEVQRPVYFACVQDSWNIYNQNASMGINESPNGPLSNINATASNYTANMLLGTFHGGFEVGGTSSIKDGELPINNSNVNIFSAAGSSANFNSTITMSLADNEAGIHIGSGVTNFYNDKMVFNGDVEVRGDLKTVSGLNNKDQKLADKHLNDELKAVKEIANQTAKDIAQGGEDTPCPHCEQKLADDKSDFVTKILRTIKKFSNILPWDCWNWGVTKFLINFIVTPMLSEISVLAVSGGKGCGMCDKGQAKSYSKSIENANKKAAETFAQKQNELNESAKHFNAGSAVQSVIGSAGIVAGAGHMNDAKCSQELPHDCSFITTGVKKVENASSISMHQCGKAVKTVVDITPHKTTAGDIYFESANDIKMVAGTPGISMKTGGKISITGGFLDLNSTEGPAVLTSKNITNVNGEKVHITGASGIGLTAPSVGVNGNLGVTGNLGVMGSVTIDGALSVKHLKIKTMRSETTSNSSPKSTSNATTYYTGGAAGINIFDKIKNVLTRDNPLKMLMLTVKGLLTIFQEVYDRVLLMIGIHPVPTGIFVGYGSGVVYNFTSNSMKVPEDHSHQIPLPQMEMAGDNAAWIQMADDPSSPVPNVAPSQGDDPPGAPRSRTGCGGGGFGFSSGSNASRRRSARNSRYGVPSNSLNYGRIIPEGYYNNTIITTTNTNLTGVSGDFITVTNDLSGNQITIYTDISGNQFTIGDGLTGTNIIIDYDITPNNQIWKYDENGEISPRDLVRFSLSEDCD